MHPTQSRGAPRLLVSLCAVVALAAAGKPVSAGVVVAPGTYKISPRGLSSEGSQVPLEELFRLSRQRFALPSLERSERAIVAEVLADEFAEEPLVGARLAVRCKRRP